VQFLEKNNMSIIRNIGVHHVAGRLTLPEINSLHRGRWPDLPSELRPGIYVGYNVVIWRDGSYYQARYVGEETAAQVGHNKDTVSFCLSGDFTKGHDVPTEAQKATLKALIRAVVAFPGVDMPLKVKKGTVVSVLPENIYPHRVLQPNHTECYGSGLSDDWARKLAFPPEEESKPAEVIAPVVLPAQSEGDEVSKLQAVLSILKRLLGLQALLNQYQLGEASNRCWDDARG
jgi:hypothetical protein